MPSSGSRPRGRSSVADELRELDAAEARLADGGYGVCVVCGGRILDAQVELRPARTTCVACAPPGRG